MDSGWSQTQKEFDRRTFESGARIFSEGQFGKDAFFVVSGKVEISQNIGGRTIVL